MPSIELFQRNHEIFKQKWIRRKEGIKFFPYPKIAFCYITKDSEAFLEYSIKSIYDFAEKIIVIDNESKDKTLEILKNFNDPDGKLRVISQKFNNKTEQRNLYCQMLDGMDFLWVVDSDEVWDRQNLLKIEHLIFARPDIPAFCFNFIDFFKDFSHISKGIWENFTGRKSLINLNLTGKIKYNTHILPITEDNKDIPFVFCKDIVFFHFSYIRSDEEMRKKYEYYKDTGTPGYKMTDDWLNVVWLDWDKNSTEVEQKYGNHLFGKPSWTEIYKGDLPEVMKTHPLYEKFLQDIQLRYYITVNPKPVSFWKNISIEKDDLFNLENNIYCIVAEQVLEKYPYSQIADLLVNWYTKLKIGGEIVIITPNLYWFAKNYVDKHLSYMDTVMGLFAKQRNDFEFNSVLFDEQAIFTLLNEVGFSKIKIEITENGSFLKVSARKEKEL